jgi:hypothetical protein
MFDYDSLFRLQGPYRPLVDFDPFFV